MASIRKSPEHVLVDVRAAERYRGEVEPLDPVAGHIPGAINLPFAGSLDEDGLFLDIAELRAIFEPLTEKASTDKIVFYCGSGVSAAHSALVFAHAGLGDALIYPGSWSKWITDPDRPVAKSDQ